MISSNGNSKSGFQLAKDGNGVDSFINVGGGSDPWETTNGVSSGTFLGSGKCMSFKTKNGIVRLTMTVRRLNGELSC